MRKFKVNYKGTEYELSMGLRSAFFYEKITGEPFNTNSAINNYILAFSCLYAADDNFNESFDDFIDYCDEHPDWIIEFFKSIPVLPGKPAAPPVKKAKTGRK